MHDKTITTKQETSDDLGFDSFDAGVVPGREPSTTALPEVPEAGVVTRWLASLEGLEALEKARGLARACGTCLTWSKVPARPPSGEPPPRAELRGALRALVERLKDEDYDAAGTVITNIAREAGADVSRSHSDIRREKGPVAPGMRGLGR